MTMTWWRWWACHVYFKTGTRMFFSFVDLIVPCHERYKPSRHANDNSKFKLI